MSYQSDEQKLHVAFLAEKYGRDADFSLTYLNRPAAFRSGAELVLSEIAPLIDSLESLLDVVHQVLDDPTNHGQWEGQLDEWHFLTDQQLDRWQKC